MTKRIVVSASILSLALVLLGWHQATADEVVLKSGIKIQGTIVEADSTKVVVQTASGKSITYKRADVAEVHTAQSEDLAKADKLLKAGQMDQAQKVLEAVVKSGGLMKSDAEIKLMQCYFSASQWEKGAQLYFSLLSAGAGEDVAGSLPWQGITGEQGAAILKGMAAAGELADVAAGVGNVVKAWAKCAQDPNADPKAALGEPLASKDTIVSGTAAVALMQLMFQRKDYDGCLAFIEKKLTKLEGPAEAWGVYWKGRCLLEKGDLEHAVLAFLRVGWTSAGSGMLAGDSLFMAAVCFEKKRQDDRAHELYREVAQEYPLAMNVAEARKKAGEQ
jgi:TolA-binding protein